MFFVDYRKQTWFWSLGDTYRIKDRPRYMSGFGSNSSIDGGNHNSHRYVTGNIVGDNNNIEVCLSFGIDCFIITFMYIGRKRRRDYSR